LTNNRNLIEELGNLVPVKNKHSVIEARATHVITSAVNLIESIRANYSPEESDMLIKRLIKSIISEDAQKFKRKLMQMKHKAGKS
jgi:hypothetical protein